MEQTAVEWLEKEIENISIQVFDGYLTFVEFMEQREKLFKQAKEMEEEQMIAFGKKCFYKGFEKAENDDANCFTAWREAVDKLITFKSE